MRMMTSPIMGLVDHTLRQYGVAEEAARQTGNAVGRVQATREQNHRITRITCQGSIWEFTRDGNGNVTTMTATFPGRLTRVEFSLAYDASGYITEVSRRTIALPGRTITEV